MLISEYQIHFDAIASIITAFCDQSLDDGYKALYFHALDKLSHKPQFPLARGRDNMWAAGTVYAIAQNCYLVGNRAFGVFKGSMSAKAKAIRDDLGITNVKKVWLHPDMREMNTMKNNVRRAIGIKL